jgi:hypothetical protein
MKNQSESLPSNIVEHQHPTLTHLIDLVDLAVAPSPMVTLITRCYITVTTFTE